MAFYKLEPFGQDWLQTGTIAAEVAKPWAKKGSKVKPASFLPVQPPERQQTPQEMWAIFETLAIKQKAKNVNDRKP